MIQSTMKNIVIRALLLGVTILPFTGLFLIGSDLLVEFLLVDFILTLMLCIVYGIDLYRRKNISKSNKVIWVVFFLIFTNISQVMYWFKYLGLNYKDAESFQT